ARADGRVADGRLVAVHVAGAAHRAGRDARPRDEHLHGRVPRRDAARQSADRAGGGSHRRAGRAVRERAAAGVGRARVPATAGSPGRVLTPRYCAEPAIQNTPSPIEATAVSAAAPRPTVRTTHGRPSTRDSTIPNSDIESRMPTENTATR